MKDLKGIRCCLNNKNDQAPSLSIQKKLVKINRISLSCQRRELVEEQSVTEYAPDPALTALQAQEGCFCNEICVGPQ